MSSTSAVEINIQAVSAPFIVPLLPPRAASRITRSVFDTSLLEGMNFTKVEAPSVDDDDDDVNPSPDLVANAEAQIVEQSKRIDFYLTEYTVEILAEKMRNEEFFVPAYQRAFTWEPERKSRFIESLLLGLPIPFLFFWEIPETGKLEIVDGSQRLRTIEEFLFGDMKLVELEQLALLQGLRFRDLLASRQRKIKNKSIRGIVLNEHADEPARLDSL